MSVPAGPPRIELARLPTPVVELERLAARWGGPRLFVKRDDLTGSTLTGNKVRKLEFSLGQAVADGARRVVTCGGLQSNHCRATAAACAQLGLACVVYLRTEEADPAPDGNHLLDLLFGAEVRFVTPEEYRALEPDPDGFWIPEGASDELGMWGYLHACAELADRRFDALVHPVGSGGTTAGLVAGRAVHGMETPLLGVPVCDDAAFFHRRVDAILAAAARRWPGLPPLPASRDAVELLDGYVGRGYALNRPEEYALIREVAATEGLVLDPVYGAKAMLGLREEIRRGRFRRGDAVLFLATGGIYGLFPKRTELLPTVNR